MRRFPYWLLLGALGASLIPDSALACSFQTPTPFVIDQSSEDDTPPATPEVQVAQIKRGKGPDQKGCSQESSSCDDIGFVLLDVKEDDQDVGYVIELSGEVPAELRAQFDGSPVEPALEPGKLRMVWIDGEGEQDLDFEVQVWSVDRAGNMSEAPVRIRVQSDGSGGCRAGRGAVGGGWLAMLCVLLLTRSRRMRRAAGRRGAA